MDVVGIQLEVETPGRLQLGGRLRGAVVVTFGLPLDEVRLTLKLRRTVRIGERHWEHEERLVQEALEGEWAAGDTLRHPVDVRLPAGAPSAAGRHVGVAWTVVAVCGSVAGADQVELPVELASAAPGTQPDAPTAFVSRRRRQVLVGAGLVGGGGLATLAIAGPAGAAGLELLTIAGAVIGGAVGAVMPVAWWLDRQDRRYAITVDAANVALQGQPLAVHLKAADAKAGELREATLALVVTEWKRAPRVVSSLPVVTAPRRLVAGDHLEVRKALTVPADTPPTVVVPDGEVDQEDSGLRPNRGIALIGYAVRLTLRLGRRTLVVERPITVLSHPG